MADKSQLIDYQVQIVGANPDNPAVVVLDEDSQYALKIKGGVNITGSSGAQAMFSVANKMETATIETSANGWNTLLNLNVPTGKAWYLKGMTYGTSRACEYRLVIGGVTKHSGNIDATDSFDIPLYGFYVSAGVNVKLEINTSANQQLKANLIAYEETI